MTIKRPNIIFFFWDNFAWGELAFLKTLAMEPPIKPGTPDPYVPPKPGDMRV